MFFVAAYVLEVIVLPSNLFIGIGLAGVVLLPTRFGRAGLRLLVAATLLLAISGLTPLPNLLLAMLEDRFPKWERAGGALDGIVVLGGAFDHAVSAARREPELNEAADRMTAAVDLARRYPQARLLFSGGSKTLSFEQNTEATFASQLFERLGIEPGRIELEERSRNTVENALFSKLVAGPKPGERWVLVTSASHMPRAIGAFRRAGFAVEAYPVDWRAGRPSDPLWFRRTLSDGLRRADIAMHEWIGLLTYWVAGHSSELFPAPSIQSGCDNARAFDACRR